MTKENKTELMGIICVLFIGLLVLWLTSCASLEDVRELRRENKVMNGRIRQLEKDEFFAAPLDEPDVEVQEVH